MKEFGVLCHVTCLPAKTGLGDFGKSAYEFLDFLKSQKLSLWQILPLNNANEFNCPYGPLSTQAIDEMFVDLDDLKDRGLLEEKEYKHLYKFTKTKKVKFSKIRPEKERLFALAYSRVDKQTKAKLAQVAKEKKHFFEYAYYRTMLAKFGQKSWRFVEEEYWDIYGKVGQKFAKENEDDILKFVFFQYVLHEQWAKIKTYANKLGIKILGDVPMYCDKDSVDVFAGKEWFKLDDNCMPTVTAGCPPDVFSSVAQDWQTCIYQWDKMKKDNFSYMTNRLCLLLDKYDMLRLDHFPGYVRYYEHAKAPGTKTQYVDGGGSEFFAQLKTLVDFKKLFVEDLSDEKSATGKVIKEFSLRKMNVLQYGFDTDKNNPHLPQNVKANIVYYAGTHDSATFLGFLKKQSKQQIEKIKLLTNSQAKNLKGLQLDCIRSMLASKAQYVVLQAQDFMFQDDRWRMNYPGVAAGCWEYRLCKDYQKKMSKMLAQLGQK